MSSETLQRLRDERDAEKAQRKELEQIILDTYGPDECEDGDVLVWSKQYTTHGGEYNYVATRAKGQWYMSGDNQVRDWTDLMVEIERDNILPITVYKVAEVEVLLSEDSDED